VLRLAPGYASGNVRYGLPVLTNMLERSAQEVAKKFPGSVLNVGHLSRQGGGEVDRHASHESGRDADVGFYVRSAQGKPLLSDSFVTFEGDGKATHWPGAFFDDARNWALISAWVTDPKARISHIFVASPLRERLLAYARKVGAHPDIRDRAAELLAQPRGSLPHDDHFHIRISCPKGMSECIEQPTVAHHRQNPVARTRQDDNHRDTRQAQRGGATTRRTGPTTPDRRRADATPSRPSRDEDPLSKLLAPRVEGLGSIVIPSRIESKDPPKADPPDAPNAPAIDDVDGPVEPALPDPHEP
jgi:penicillin-insensitive murein endopeptidase